MPLPDTIRVKLSSEAAEGISVTPVVVQDIPLFELVERMLGVTGKNARRIRELLARGSLVSGASRFRWTGWEAPLADLERFLTAFPDSDPERRFDPERCQRILLRGPAARLDLPRAAAARRRFLRRRSLWEILEQIAAAHEPAYIEYSYGERADVYRLDLDPGSLEVLRRNAAVAAWARLEAQLRADAFHCLEFHISRP